MTTKTCVLLFLFVGSSLGEWLPSLFGADLFSLWGIVGSTAGGLLGIWIGYWIGENYL